MNLKKLLFKKETIKEEIVKNTAWLTFAEVFSRILSFFLAVWVARYLGVANYGKYNFVFSFPGLFVVLTDFGLSTLTIREVSRDRALAKKYINNIILLKFILSTLTLLGIVIISQFLGKTEEVKVMLYFAAIVMIFQSLNQFFQSIFRSFGKMEYEFLSRIIFSIVLFLASLSVIYLNLGVLFLVLCSLLATIISFTVTILISTSNFGRFKMEFDKNFLSHLVKESFPFFLSGIFVSIYWYIDVTMLSLIKSDLIVGWYTAATKLIFFLLIIPSIVFSAVFPVSSRLYEVSNEKLKAIFRRSFELMAIIAIPLAIGTTMTAGKIIFSLYGSAFAPSVFALQILIWGLMFAFLAVPFENLFSSINKQYVLVKEFGIAALLNVALNLWLIPRYSFQGAAFSTLAVWIFELIYLFMCFRKTTYLPKISYFLNLFAKIFLASFLMGLTIFFLQNWPLFLIIFISIGSYFSFLYFLDRDFFIWTIR